MNALTRRLAIAAVAAPSIGAVAVVAMLVAAFAAVAGTDTDSARGGAACAVVVVDGIPCGDSVAWSAGDAVGGANAGSASDGVTAGGWGGYSNGLIPASALCPLSAAGQLLRCDAASQWNAMSAAYQQQSGAPICITDSYRTFEVQVRLRQQKPTLAAVPGTSNHGWALAVDLCEAGHTGMGFATATFRWLKGNAEAFGWVHPSWADPGRGQEEPWHWEYVGGAS